MLKVVQESKEDLLSAQTQMQSPGFQLSQMSVLVLLPPTRYPLWLTLGVEVPGVWVRHWNCVRLKTLCSFMKPGEVERGSDSVVVSAMRMEMGLYNLEMVQDKGCHIYVQPEPTVA